MNAAHKLQPWRLLSRQRQLDSPWLRVEAETVELPDGSQLSPFYTVHMRPWACVIPRLSDGRYLMVRQYRRAIDAISLEFPAGDIDADESPDLAARRECREETGHDCRHPWQALGYLVADPSHIATRGYGFLSAISTQRHPTSHDASEIIELAALSAEEIHAAIASGALTHAFHVAFFYRAEAFLQAHPDFFANIPAGT